MESKKMAALIDELTKIALNRWEQAAMTGELNAGDLHKMGPSGIMFNGMMNSPDVGKDALEASHATDVGTTGRNALKSSRDSLWGPQGAGEFTEEQLARHRDLQQRLGERSLKSLGGIGVNMPGRGPVTLGSKVMVGPNAGTFMRRIGEGAELGEIIGSTLPSAVAKHLNLISGAEMPEAKDVDKTLYRAVVEHEGGEKALARGMAETRKPGLVSRLFGKKQDPSIALPARPIASHYGFLPDLEEKHVAWRDPEAQQLLGKVRQTNPDDAYMDALHRQFGGRPDAPIPMGGKQHAEIERRLAAHTPQVEQAVQMRGQLAPHGLSHGVSRDAMERAIQIPRMFADSMKAQAEQMGGIGGAVVNEAHGALQGLIDKRIAGAVGHAVDPADVGGAIMKLRSLVRK